MIVEDVRIASIAGNRVELRATCGGKPLYYRVPESRFRRDAVGDVLVLSTLVPAMRAQSPIQLPPQFSVSSQLASNLPKMQRVWSSWNFSLKRVSLEASTHDVQPAASDVGLFYGGGVDASYSLIVHLEEVDFLVLAFGFDFSFSQEEIRKSVLRNSRFSERLGKELVPVETNHSQFVASLGVSRQLVYGATLACVGLLLGPRTCYIASGHSAANMRPDGSHPVLDHLFSNGITEFIHDDVSVVRLEKTWAVAKHPDFLDNLRVCWDSHDENCGTCSKCLRTMVALRLCGTEGPFPPLRDLRLLRRMAASTELEYVVGMILAAHERGDREVVRQLKRGLRVNDRKEAIRYLDQALLGGQLRRWYTRQRGIELELLKVNLRPDLDIP